MTPFKKYLPYSCPRIFAASMRAAIRAGTQLAIIQRRGKTIITE
jgi:hypothetical protein